MTSTSTPKLTPDQIDDLLYCARAGETDDLLAYLDELLASSSSLTTQPAGEDATKDRQTKIAAILEQTLDEAGNGMLHYASANGHLETLQILLPNTTLKTILHQNISGNTPLHWAGLNGHLSIVKSLVERIDQLEVLFPQEANGINLLKHEVEAKERRIRKEKIRREQVEAARIKEREEQIKAEGGGGGRGAQEDSFPPSSVSEEEGSNEKLEQEEEEEEEDEPQRSLWDIRNHFGRGPTSEAQMNDREEVVQFLLQHMVDGPPSTPAAAAPRQPEPVEAGKKDEEDISAQTTQSLSLSDAAASPPS